jgi:protein TonB
MNRHLSKEQISRCLIGDGTPGETQHVSTCAACSGEIASLESSLSQFRSSVRNWSDQLSGPGGSCLDRSFTSASIFEYTFEYTREQPWYKGVLPAGLGSVIFHGVAVAALLFVGTLQPVQQVMKEFVPLFAPDPRPLQSKPKPEQSKGGGGGPQKTEVTKGELPKVAPKSFVPPIRPETDPKLAMNPTIVAPDLPNISSNNFGNPLAGLGIPSAGNGNGIGIGPGNGPGIGPGRDGGFGTGVYRIGGGVSAPVPVFHPEPEYSEEARKAKWQGSVVLQIVVDDAGVPQEIKVIHSVGLGLDQKAIEAVRKWRFKPGLKDGKPVPVSANIEVNFRLL